MASGMARQEGLSEALIDRVAIVATEVGTNLVKHGKGGEVLLTPLSPHGGAGLEILGIDRGPGMRDVAQCLADGYSSVQTSGTGLGAIARLSTGFDIYSQEDGGTVLAARLQQSGVEGNAVGAVLKPVASERISGDAWSIRREEGGLALLVADGLGHGPIAAAASAQAVAAFHADPNLSPDAVIRRVHAALHGTRGAAVAVAYVDFAHSRVRYAGIGNIGGLLVGGGKPIQMVSHNGTAGYEFPRLQEFTYPLQDETLVVMHSDGLQSFAGLDAYPGLRRRDPAVIAGVLYRDLARQRDDICVVVSRVRGFR
jgi:anti-sigma regulatory factor (Ser/Thr protein kinase)